jgi:hypothetical protein
VSRKLRGADVPIYDLNGFPKPPITLVQARRLVQNGEAIPSTQLGSGELPGWKDNPWRSWPAIKLVRPLKEDMQSPCSLTENDCHLVAGEAGKTIAAKRAEERLYNWPQEHDTRSVTIVAGRGAWIPDAELSRKRAELQLKLHMQRHQIEQSEARRMQSRMVHA